MRQVLGAVRDIRRAGSAALDLAWVACGRLDGFFETGINHWDYAGGCCSSAEAGALFAVRPRAARRPLQVLARGPASIARWRALAG